MFGNVGKENSIKKIRLTSKLMTSQPGLQAIPIHILSNVSQTKSNRAMKFDKFK